MKKGQLVRLLETVQDMADVRILDDRTNVGHFISDVRISFDGESGIGHKIEIVIESDEH